MPRTLSLPSKTKKTAAKKAARPVASKVAAKKTILQATLKAIPQATSKTAPKSAKVPVKAVTKAKSVAPAKVTLTASSKAEFSKSPFNSSLKPAQKINFLREMLRIRRFEQQALKYYNQGIMGGFLHLYNGQESVAVGTASLMNGHDEIITAYRDHGHALAVGMGMNECMAELFGKGTG